MRRTLSSARTFPMKFVFPTVWLSGFTMGTLAFFMGGGFTDPQGFPPPPEIKWLFLGVTMVGAGFIYWFCIRLKRVEIDEGALYVSNYLREIRVPLEQIEEVSENRWINIRPVTVEFRQDTEFGSRIIFMPKTLWAFWRPHPVVGEIDSAIRQVRGLPALQPK
jgi:hypothetical protein